MGLFVMAVQAHALACGDTISTDTTLRQHLLDCPGDGLIIGASGITLNLNGKRITGMGDKGSAGVAVENVEDVTIRNGTVQNFGTQIFIVGSHRTLVRHMVLRDGTGLGMQVRASNDVEVRHSRLSNLRGAGLLVILADNFVLRHSRIVDVGTGGNANCGGGAGISSFRSAGVTIRNNLFKRISRSGMGAFGDSYTP